MSSHEPTPVPAPPAPLEPESSAPPAAPAAPFPFEAPPSPALAVAVDRPAPTEPGRPLRERLGDTLGRVRRGLRAAGQFGDFGTARLARIATGWLKWPVLLAMATGSGLWSFAHPGRLASLDENDLTAPERHAMVGWVGAAFGAILLVAFVASLVRRLRGGAFRLADSIERTCAWLSLLAALPFVSLLRTQNIERDSPKLTIFLVACAAALALPTFFAWRRAEPSIDEDAPAPGALRRAAAFAWRSLPLLLVLGIWAGYAWFFSRLSITNHHALVTRTIDLGYYDNIFWQSSHGNPLGCTFMKGEYHGSGHFDPMLVVLSPLYLLYPRAEMLLVLQSVWLGAGVVPVYLMARTKLRSAMSGVVLALAFALYPAMHGANMYEFHSLTLIGPLVLWLLYFFEIRATKRYFLTLLALLLCREDVPLLMCFVGLHGLLDGRAGRARLGWTTIVVSLVYFVVVKTVFMTSSGILEAGKEAYSFGYYYEDLIPPKTGMLGLVVSLLTNPVFAVEKALEEPKIVFLLVLFLPLCFLPFTVPKARLMLVYGLLFCLLATRSAVYSTHFQYSSILYPIAFALTPMALARIAFGPSSLAERFDGKRLARGLLGASLVASALLSWKFGGLVENATFRGGFSRVTRSLNAEQQANYAWVREQVAKIPARASVGTTNRLGAHVSNRRRVYFYPHEKQRTEYLFIDEAELKGGDAERHGKLIARGELVELGRRGRLALFRRLPPTAVAVERSPAARPEEPPAAAPPAEPAAPGAAGEEAGEDP